MCAVPDCCWTECLCYQIRVRRQAEAHSRAHHLQLLIAIHTHKHTHARFTIFFFPLYFTILTILKIGHFFLPVSCFSLPQYWLTGDSSPSLSSSITAFCHSLILPADRTAPLLFIHPLYIPSIIHSFLNCISPLQFSINPLLLTGTS